MDDTRRTQMWLYVAAFGLIVVLLFPVYWMVLTAVLPSRQLLAPTPPLIPPLGDMNFAAFPRVFELRPVGWWVFNSAVVAGGAVISSVTLSVMSGYSLSRLASRFGMFVGYSLFAVRLIPTTLLVIPLFMMFNAIGLRNNLAALIIANTVIIVPFGAWLMKGFFDSIPFELEQSAMVDGCNRWQGVVRIVLPLAKPGIGAVAIFSGILAWGEFAFARTLMTGERNATVTVGLVGFVGEYTVDWSALMAAGLISIAPMVLLFVLLEPLLVSGLTGGAVKE